MPFSNAYHDSQSSALTLLYAAVTFVQHTRADGEGELADAVLGGDELANDHAGEGVPDAEPEPREDEGHGARKHDTAEDQRVRRAEGSRDPKERGLRVPDAGHGVDDDREERSQEDDRDLRLDVDPEPDDEQRQEDDARRAVEEVDERVHRVLEPGVPAHGETEDQADEHRQAVADR